MSDGTLNAGSGIRGMVNIGGYKKWLTDDGRLLPVVMGGDGDGGGGAAADGQGGNAGTGGEAAAGSDGGGNTVDPQKVTFTPEQQAKVQEIIDRTHAKANEKSASEIAGLQAQLDEMKKGPPSDKGGKKGEGGQPVDTTEMEKALKAKDDEIAGFKAEKLETQRVKKANAIMSSLSKHPVIDVGDVAKLIDSHIRMDENGGLTVQGENNAPKVNASGQPMIVDEFITSWLAERAHFLRPSASQGAGSQGAKFGEPGGTQYDLSDPAVWRNMPKEDFDRLKKQGIEVTLGSGQTYKFKDRSNPFLEAKRAKLKEQRG